MIIGQSKAMWQCKWPNLVANFRTNASGATWWPNLELMQVAPSGGQIWMLPCGCWILSNSRSQFLRPLCLWQCFLVICPFSHVFLHMFRSSNFLLQKALVFLGKKNHEANFCKREAEQFSLSCCAALSVTKQTNLEENLKFKSLSQDNTRSQASKIR